MLRKFIEFSEDLGKRTLHINHYRRAALITVPLVFILLILYAHIGCISDLAYAKWFLNILPLPGFLGHLLSSTTYIGNALDQRHNPERRSAFFSTSAGIALGLVIGITLSYMLPGAVCFSTIITSMIFTMRCISTYAGLFSRGCTIAAGIRNYRLSNPQERHGSEIAFLLTALVVGITCGIYLFINHSAKMISLLGVVTFFTPGLTALLTISPVICGFIFISMFTSALMSGTDYFSKGVTFLKEMIMNRNFEPSIQKFHEYRGSLLGGFLSLTVGVILLIAHLHILCGTIGLLTAMMIGATSFSIVGGVFSRLGLTFDGLFEEEDSLTKKTCIVITTAIGYTGLLAAVCPFILRNNNAKNDSSQPSEINQTRIISQATVLPPTSKGIRLALTQFPRKRSRNTSPDSSVILTDYSSLQPRSLESLTTDDTESATQLPKMSFLSPKPSPRLTTKNVVSCQKSKLSCAIL